MVWLDSHIDYESSVPDRRALPTLDRMRQLASLLDDPQSSVPSIHLTGTNGKGSTAAMVTALLGAQGLVVGTYTSPNLSRVNERLCIAGEPIDDDAFCEVLSALAALEGMLDQRPTRFELLTAAALRWFADEAVDAMVIEVGLGGTWDCTNVVDAEVAVVTNISYDHTEVLGPTLEGIARDKAGIAKAGSRVVVGETDPGLVSIIRDVADGAGAAEVWVRGEEFDCTANRLAVGGRLLDLRTPAARYGEVLVPLHGAHQGRNAACAVAAAEAFFATPLDDSVVESALGGVRVPGRLEVLRRHPLVVVDGAHNVAGMDALADALTEAFAVEGRTVAVVGMLRGRDPSAMLAPLVRAGVDELVVCEPRSLRAMPADEVAEAARGVGLTVSVVPTVEAAVGAASARVDDDGLLLVAGSLYVVGDARALLVEGAPRT